MRLNAPTTEGWPSGLRRTPGKCVYGKPYRGFESRLLRQSQKTITNQQVRYDATHVRDTYVGHIDDAKHALTHDNRSRIHDGEWVTNVGHITGSHRAKRYPIGLFRRGTVWQFRKRVPNDVISMFGRKFIKQSLKTGDYRLAARLAVKLAYEWEIMFEQLRANRAADIAAIATITVPKVPDPIASSVAKAAEPVQPLVVFGGIRHGQPNKRSITIKELHERYMADPSIARSPKTLIAYQSIYARVLGLMDENTRIDQITREDCRTLLNAVRLLPAHAVKLYGHIPLPQMVERAKAEGRHPMSPTTINSYVQRFSTLLNWAVKEDYLDKNPARGLRVIDPVRKKDKRLPFSTEQLNIIFNAPIYTGCKDDERGYAEIGTARPRRSKFWIPLIGLYSGMRLNEICQLNKEDIRKIDDIPCFVVTTDASGKGDDKRLKTRNAERIIPVHPMLIKIGFLDFVRKRQNGSHPKLFNDLQMAASGYYSDLFSKWFIQFLNNCGAKRPKTSFHSFRHNFRDAMREAKIDKDIAYALGGWASDRPDDTAVTAENYGNGYKTIHLFQAIKQVAYLEMKVIWLHHPENN